MTNIGCIFCEKLCNTSVYISKKSVISSIISLNVLSFRECETMTEIEAIKDRHSVRNFVNQKIAKDLIEKLNIMIVQCNAEGNLHFQFFENAGNTFKNLVNKATGLESAPGVIICAGRDDATLDERIGYYGEKIVLYAQMLGLNTCWTATFNKKHVNADIRNDERIVVAIAIGYGENTGKPHKSKKPGQVIIGKGEKPYWFNYGVKMALLAPTALNQQRFEIELLPDGKVKFHDKGGILNKVNLGIVRYHFEAGVNHINKSGKKTKG